MTEIGGYFGLESFGNHPYYPDLIAVNNARNALLYLLKARQIKKLYLPYFLCDSVAAMCEREGYAYAYYHIDRNFMPIFDQMPAADEYLYVVNYYGQIRRETAIQLQKRYGNLILDNVQAFFQRPIEGMDTVYSCRKFFGVPDGGYVSTDAVLEEQLLPDISKDRMEHVLGRFEGSASEYYAAFKENDHSFLSLELRAMSKLTRNLLGAIDYEQVRQRRNANYALLEQLLGQYNALTLTAPDGPYAYPFYCEKGMELKKLLAQKKIFVATLWPNVLAMEDTLEKEYAENILPLPCDQRYEETDMQEMVKEILKCIN